MESYEKALECNMEISLMDDLFKAKDGIMEVNKGTNVKLFDKHKNEETCIELPFSLL